MEQVLLDQIIALRAQLQRIHVGSKLAVWIIFKHQTAVGAFFHFLGHFLSALSDCLIAGNGISHL